MSDRETAGLRASVERRSAVLLVFLHQLPRWVLLVVAGVLLVLGMAGTGWPGAIALLLLAAFLGWFAYLSWPATQVPGRALRVGALAVLVAFAAGHIAGQF
jgi:apolipoprotein N-acyltransferase